MNERAVRHVGTLCLGMAAACALIPLALMTMNALKPHAAIVRNPLSFPVRFDFSNFREAWTEGHFAIGMVNSLLLCASTIVITIAAASLAAYPLARGAHRIWKLITLYFLCSVTVPIQIFLFPLYFIFARLGLIGNVFATAAVLSAINLPLSILLLRTSILAIPAELDDAARMDGAGHWHIFWHVILPLMRPGLVTAAIVVLLNSWNEFLITSTFQQGENHFTMTLGYRAMNGSLTADEGLLMAGAVIVIAPVLIVFLAMQRFFIEGMTAGAVKG